MFQKMLVVLVLIVLSLSCASAQVVHNVWQSPEGTPAVHNVFVYFDKADIGLYGVNKEHTTIEAVPYFASAKSGKWSVRIGADGAVGQNKLQWYGLVACANGEVGNVKVALPLYFLRNTAGTTTAMTPGLRLLAPVSKSVSAGVGGNFCLGNGKDTVNLGPLVSVKTGQSEFRFRYTFPLAGGSPNQVRGEWLIKL